MSARRMSGRLARLALALCAFALVAGCQYNGLSGVTLPGGAAFGHPTYAVSAVFDDVLNLVPQAAVKVNDVAVGSVDSVRLVDQDGVYRARVTMRIRQSVRVPANSVATLRQTSLLGEKFIALGPPAGTAPEGTLAAGAVIPNDRTGRNPEVEEVFSALSALLNGGGVAQLQTISVELSNVLAGRENNVRDLLRQLNTFVGDLDARKSEVVRALDGLDRLTGILAQQRQTIAVAIDDIEPGLRVLADERAQLTALLSGLAKLGTVGTRVIDASQRNTVADLQALQPVLTELGKADGYIVKSLPLLLVQPFPPNTIRGIPGDYGNLVASIDVDVATVLGNLTGNPALAPAATGTRPSPGGSSSTPAPAASPPKLPLPKLPLPKLPLPKLPKLPLITAPTGPAPGGPDGASGALRQLLMGGLR